MLNRVLIVSQIFEPSVNEVVAHLTRMGIPWARLNCEEFPLLSQGAIEVDASKSVGRIKLENGVLDSREISSVWFRRVGLSPVPKGLSLRDREFIQNESKAFLNGFFDLLRCPWINDRSSERIATSKIHQLDVARRIGLTVPRTLVTNDIQAVEEFLRLVGGPVVFKPVSGYSPRGADFSREFARYAADRIPYELEVPEPELEVDVVFSQLLTEERIQQLRNVDFVPLFFKSTLRKIAKFG